MHFLSFKNLKPKNHSHFMHVSLFEMRGLLLIAFLHFAESTQPSKLLDINDTFMLLIDHQVGTLKFCRSIPQKAIIQNTRALARFAKVLNIPVLLTSRLEDRAQGQLINDLKDILPEQYESRIKRSGIANPFEDPAYRSAVEKIAQGKKNVIMAGLTNDVCVAYPARSMAENGYNVVVVQDAGGSPSSMADETARRFWEAAGCRTITTAALSAELEKDWGSPQGSKMIGVVMEEIISKLDEMGKF